MLVHLANLCCGLGHNLRYGKTNVGQVPLLTIWNVCPNVDNRKEPLLETINMFCRFGMAIVSCYSRLIDLALIDVLVFV
jgi:hypothetical protein